MKMRRAGHFAPAIFGLSLLVMGIGLATERARDDVYTNAEIAHERMILLTNAIMIYINEYAEMPADLADLYPDYVSDPLTFWHPGDNDPPPETIDNSVPDAPNSARISFEFAPDFFSVAPDDFVIWDNTAGNNGGLFIGMLTTDRVWETDPPSATPTPSEVALAQEHLSRIGLGMMLYLNDSYGFFPDDLIRLWHAEGGQFTSPRTFWNPGDSDPLPEDITNSILDDPDSVQVSFEYLVAGLMFDDISPDTMLLKDISADNNAGLGINVLWGDAHVSFEPSHPFGDYDRDCHIDLVDFAAVQVCFTQPEAYIEDDACRIYDWDFDSRVDLPDFENFVDAMTGPAEFVPDCMP
jgi:hypothetical protein